MARILLGRGADPYWEHSGFDFAAWSLSFFLHICRSGSKSITVNMKHRYISYATASKSSLDKTWKKRQKRTYRGSLYMHEPIIHYDRMTLLKEDNFA
jgi:hypothetical protein